MGGQCLLVLIGLKVLLMHNSLRNIVSDAQGLLMLMGSKILIKKTRPQNTVFYLNVCGLVIFTKNFNPINIRRPWAPEITMFFSKFIMTKTFKPIKTRRHGHPFDLTSFQQGLFLVLGCSFLHLAGVLLIRFLLT